MTARDRTGSFLMVHGACVSIGCFALTDTGIEEIWTLMQAAFEGGRGSVPVHIFPFQMTPQKLQLNADNDHAEFWQALAQGWIAFETSGRIPDVSVRRGDYVVLAAQ